MKEYFEEHDKYPGQLSGDASKYIGFKITWVAINLCLKRGNRGLPGGSSLAQLRQEYITGIETLLTEEIIVKAMKDYHEEHGKYPSQLSGDASKYAGFKITWKAINSCLRQGNRSLPGGSSLAQLRKEYITGKETPLIEDLIVKAMKDYHEEHGKYPVANRSGDASKYIGFKITWTAINTCLKKGLRGLPKGSSLAQLRKEYITGEKPLTEDFIVKAIKSYYEEHGKYPSCESGDASKYIGFKITWSAIDTCLREGLRGLPGGSTLAQLKQDYNLGIEPDLTEDLIVKAIKDYFEEHDKYPPCSSGDASKYIGFKITWLAIDRCLRDGNRGLPGGSSLFKLRKEYNLGIEPDLTEEIIVKAMKDYHEEHGKYPSLKSGDASKYIGFKITWTAIDACLREGFRGLPGGSSLAQLRKEYNLGIEPDLTEDLIIKAMKDYHEEHGKYPSLKSGDASKYIGFKTTWVAIDDCLRHGLRGLPGGSSLSQLRKEHITGKETPLTEEIIVKAMKAYHEECGKYPSCESGDASKYIGFKITWMAIDTCLKRGHRGLPGKSSLGKLKKKYKLK